MKLKEPVTPLLITPVKIVLLFPFRRSARMCQTPLLIESEVNSWEIFNEKRGGIADNEPITNR